MTWCKTDTGRLFKYLFALLFTSVASFFKTMFLKKFNDETLLNSQYQLRTSIPFPAQRLCKWLSVGFNPAQLQKYTKIIIIIILRDSWPGAFLSAIAHRVSMEAPGIRTKADYTALAGTIP